MGEKEILEKLKSNLYDYISRLKTEWYQIKDFDDYERFIKTLQRDAKEAKRELKDFRKYFDVLESLKYL